MALKHEELPNDRKIQKMGKIREKIDSFRKNIFWYKYLPMLIGMSLFVIGLIFTLYIGVNLLHKTPVK
jgi:hypothetical protein